MFKPRNRLGHLLRSRPGRKQKPETHEARIARATIDRDFAEVMLAGGFRSRSLTRIHYNACFTLGRVS